MVNWLIAFFITLDALSYALASLLFAPVPFQLPTEPVALPNGPEAASKPLAVFELAPVPFQENTLPTALLNGQLALSMANAFFGAPGLA